MVDIKPRSAWGAASPTSRVPLSPKRLQVHWEGTPLGLTSPDQVPARILSTQRFHMGTRAMSDIAYNLLVDPWGGVWAGRGLGVRSGANGTTESNRDNLAVCVLLGEGDPPASDAVFAALAALRDELELPLIAHRDVKPTACPGDHIAGWVHANAQPMPAVQVPTPVPQEDSMRFVKRDGEDPRAYLTNGAWKQRMPSWDDLVQKADDLNIEPVVVPVDAGVVNRMLTIGDDPT